LTQIITDFKDGSYVNQKWFNLSRKYHEHSEP